MTDAVTDPAVNPCPAKPAVTDAASLPWYCYPRAYTQFIGEIGEHQMQVLHDEGLYRHLRFKAPGTMIWHFDLITWPGYLAFVGDVGRGYVFHREPDMLRFFDHGQPLGHINADYWAEKLTGGRESVRRFSEDRFTEYVNARVQDWCIDLADEDAARLRSQVSEEVLDYACDQRLALDALAGFTFDGKHLELEMDSRSFTDYDHHFVLALHALLWGAIVYHASEHARP